MVKEQDRVGVARSDKGEAGEFAKYPDNNLGEQMRSFADVPSLHTVVMDHFQKKN